MRALARPDRRYGGERDQPHPDEQSTHGLFGSVALVSRAVKACSLARCSRRVARAGWNLTAKHRKRALAIGEKLGVFSDYPTSKGCTSPFAPIWISEMVSRQG